MTGQPVELGRAARLRTAPASSSPRSCTATRPASTPSRSSTGARSFELSPEEHEALAEARAAGGGLRCGSPTSARPGPSPRTRCARRGGCGRSSAADDDRLRRDPRRRARRGGSRAGPVRELDRGLGARDPRHPARLAGEVTIVGEHDYPVRPSLIAREELALGRDRGGPLPPAAARPVRAASLRAELSGARDPGGRRAPPRRCGS